MFVKYFLGASKEDQRLQRIVAELHPNFAADPAGIRWNDVTEKWRGVSATASTNASAGASSEKGGRSKRSDRRTAKQIRERWYNRLRPGLKRKGAPWSESEMASLIRLHGELGNSWARIAAAMGGSRSQNNVKNKWNSLQKSRTFCLAYKKHIARRSEKGGIAKFAAAVARKVCSKRSCYEKDGDLASTTSEESDASDTEQDAEDEKMTNGVDRNEEDETKATGETKTNEKQDALVEMGEVDDDDGYDSDNSVTQSESQLDFGRRLEQYKWEAEQERKIELFRRGRPDCGLTCADVQRLKLLGLGLGVAVLRKRYFGDAADLHVHANGS